MSAPSTRGVYHLEIFKSISRVVAGMAVVGLAVFGGFQIGQRDQPDEPVLTDRSQPTLLKSVQDISQYHGAVGNFEVMVDLEEDEVAWLPEFLEGRRTLFVAAGTVNSHVDLSGLATEDLKLSADGTSATIRLPEAELDKPNLNFDRSYIFDQNRGAFDRVVDAFETPEQTQFYKLAESKMATAAEESELRAQATENTKILLSGMFGSLGIDVTFLEDASS